MHIEHRDFCMKMTKKVRNKAPVSPLRYPGAKRWISGYISRSISYNNLKPQLFVEPFAGGASVSLSLLYMGLVERIILIDQDPLISAFWKTLFFDTNWLVDQVLETDVTLENWEYYKQLQPLTTRQKAFKCLYLNRTSYSGILAPNAGPIGGKSQTSEYKIDCRFNKETIVKRILRVAQYRDRVAFIWNLHWKTALGKIQRMQGSKELPERAFFYLDPPFYNKAEKLYTYYFKQKDHLALRDHLVSFDQPWILSYDSCSEIVSIYKEGKFKACDVNLIYRASQYGKGGSGKEVVVSNLTNMVSELQLGVGKNTTKPRLLSENFICKSTGNAKKATHESDSPNRRTSNGN